MATKSEQSYQTLNEKLDTIMEQLQAEDLDVDSAIKLYEQGLKLVEQLEVKLEAAENKVRELQAGNDA